MTGPRWPLTPLLGLPGVTPGTLHQLLGGSYTPARTHGLSDRQADHLAVRLGYHPANIWPNWHEPALTELDRDYIAGGWRQAWLWTEAS